MSISNNEQTPFTGETVKLDDPFKAAIQAVTEATVTVSHEPTVDPRKLADFLDQLDDTYQWDQDNLPLVVQQFLASRSADPDAVYGLLNVDVPYLHIIAKYSVVGNVTIMIVLPELPKYEYSLCLTTENFFEIDKARLEFEAACRARFRPDLPSDRVFGLAKYHRNGNSAFFTVHDGAYMINNLPNKIEEYRTHGS